VGSAGCGAAGEPGRPDDCRPAVRAQLGPTRSLPGEAFGGLFSVVGRARVAVGRSRAYLGLARGSRPSRG
jgi:hypothetical protein